MCPKKIELGKKVVVMPFPAAGEGCYLVAHLSCLPQAEGVKDNEVGYFLEGSGWFFVPIERVADLEPIEDWANEVLDELYGPKWSGIENEEEEEEDHE